MGWSAVLMPQAGTGPDELISGASPHRVGVQKLSPYTGFRRLNRIKGTLIIKPINRSTPAQQ